MRVLEPSDYRRMPWKNGGGETIEIAVDPPGAGLDDFSWRLSMARVARDGPFSSFPGVDRTLCVLEGEGIELSVEGFAPAALRADSPPHIFPGDAAASAKLIEGPILDLNAMTRRDRAHHFVTWLGSPGQPPLQSDMPAKVDEAFILCLAGEAEVSGPQGRAHLTAGQTLHASGRRLGAWHILPSAQAHCYFVEFLQGARKVKDPAIRRFEPLRGQLFIRGKRSP